MTPAQETTVLYFQAIAAVLMGVDYYLGSPFRDRLEGPIRTYFLNVQSRVDKDLAETTTRIKSAWPMLASGSVLAISCYLAINFLAPLGTAVHPALGALAGLLGLGAMAGALYAFQAVLLRAAFDYAIALPFRAFTTWLLLSPKGPIAALGFLSLIWSFILRYVYINGGG